MAATNCSVTDAHARGRKVSSSTSFEPACGSASLIRIASSIASCWRSVPGRWRGGWPMRSSSRSSDSYLTAMRLSGASGVNGGPGSGSDGGAGGSCGGTSPGFIGLTDSGTASASVATEATSPSPA